MDQLQKCRQRRKRAILPGQEADRLPQQVVRLKKPAEGAIANVQIPQRLDQELADQGLQVKLNDGFTTIIINMSYP